MLSKCSALWLVVLILLPFTAPFPTCDIADFFGRSAANHGLATVPPTSSTTLIANAESSLLVPPLASTARQLRQVGLVGPENIALPEVDAIELKVMARSKGSDNQP
jgi:hypothetical protein